MNKNEESLRDSGIKYTNICIMGAPKGAECEKREETMAKHFPSLRKKLDIQIQEAQRTPTRMKQKGSK